MDGSSRGICKWENPVKCGVLLADNPVHKFKNCAVKRTALHRKHSEST